MPAPSTSPSPEQPTPTASATPEGGFEPGVVYFGANYDDNLLIVDPRDTFSRSEKFAWAFYVNDPFGVRKLTFVIEKVTNQGKRIAYTLDIDVDPAWTHLANRFKLGSLLKVGKYLILYYNDNQVIAEGAFSLVK